MSSSVAAEKPNIIFILCDDLGWGDLGAFYQNSSTHVRTHKTPGLDRMAAEGMQLRAHYCPAPVCAPSRASLLTGVHQGHASVRDNQFDKMLADNHTLPSVLKQAGYRTALIGKYGLQGDGASAEDWTSYPTRRGFDHFFGYVSHYAGHIHYPADDWPLGDSAGHRTPKELWNDDQQISDQLSKCYTTDLFTAHSKDWIRQHVRDSSQQPFFLYLAFDTPHAALQVPSVAYPPEPGLRGGVQWLGKPGQMINTARGEIDSYRHPDYVGRGWSDVEERFATMVRRIDDCVTDLLQTLRDLEIDDQTMVVLTSDNGPHHESYLDGKSYDPTSFQSYGPFEGTKRDTWEAGIRMPTLVWWPNGVAAGSIADSASQFHDWMPTFAQAAGTVAPARTDGVSLLPTLTGEGEQQPSTIYVEYWHRGGTKNYDDFAAAKQGATRGQMQVIHLDGYKGIRNNVQSHDTPFAIYDLKRDPKERNNLAGTSEVMGQLQQKMHDRVLQLRRPNATARRPYDAEFVPASSAKPMKKGLQWEAYVGPFEYVPRVADLKPIRRGSTDNLQLDSENLNEDGKLVGAVHYEGFLKVPRDDSYTFVLRAERGAFLRIHDAAVVDADFGCGPNQQKSGTIRLKAGFHPISLTCRTNGSGASNVSLRWAPNGTAPKPPAAGQLFH